MEKLLSTSAPLVFVYIVLLLSFFRQFFHMFVFKTTVLLMFLHCCSDFSLYVSLCNIWVSDFISAMTSVVIDK